MDTIYNIAQGRVGKFLHLEKPAISMDVFTDEMIYAESWKNLNIRILLIVFQTQVIIMSRSVDQKLRETAIAALQQ
jgi:hypothetical protein